jgi:hypothetical protein
MKQRTPSPSGRWLAVLAVAVAVQAGFATPAAAQPQPVLQATPALVDFGTIVQFLPPPVKYVTVTNVSNIDLGFSEYYYPPPGLDLTIDCRQLRPGESCSVAIALDARTLGSVETTYDVSAYTLDSLAAVPPARITIKWNVIPGRIVFSVPELDFGMQPVGSAPTMRMVTLTNIGPVERELTWGVAGTECATFDVIPPLCIAQQQSYSATGTCGESLQPGESCDLTIAFQPVRGGNLIAQLVVDFADPLALVGGGLPVPQNTPGTVLAVEYFDATLGHYFVTVTPGEMDVLDREGAAGWQRTGQSFWVYPADGSAPAGSNPVCRFYGLPEAGLDSHFYSASPQECQAVIDRFSWAWLLESAAYFYAFLPQDDGACTAQATAQRATTWLLRAYNNRPDANHRFTTSRFILDQMQSSRGWVPEGYGIYSNAMCLPW